MLHMQSKVAFLVLANSFPSGIFILRSRSNIPWLIYALLMVFRIVSLHPAPRETSLFLWRKEQDLFFLSPPFCFSKPDSDPLLLCSRTYSMIMGCRISNIRALRNPLSGLNNNNSNCNRPPAPAAASGLATAKPL